jgi:uncharacterized protein (DUF1697 family)
VTRHVALLRAINVGGRNRVPMADLRALTQELGYTDVATYVQSGNVVLSATENRPERVAAHLHEHYSDHFGFDIPVLVRSRAQLRRIVAADPFGAETPDPARRHVYFLDDAVTATRLADLDLDAYAPDALKLAGHELHLSTPDGQGRSKLAQALTPKRLGTTATARNWRTVQTLLDMTGN